MSAINSSGIENEKKNEKKNENKKMMKRSAYNNAARTIDSIIISCEPAEYATARINNRKFKRMIDVLSLEQRMQLFARLITGVYIIPFLRLVFLAFIFHYGFLHLFMAINTSSNSKESGPTFRNVSSNVSLPLALSNSTMQVSFQDLKEEPSRKKLLRPPFVITLNDTLQLIDLTFPLLPETSNSVPKPKPKLSKTISSKSKGNGNTKTKGKSANKKNMKENEKVKNKITNTNIKIKKAKVATSKPNHQPPDIKSPVYGYLVMENGIAVVYENGDVMLYEKINPEMPTC